MAIKGLDQFSKIPRLGKLRLGIKMVSEKDKNKSWPKAVDYFVCSTTSQTPAEIVKSFKEIYGDKPKSLDIIFPTNDINWVIDTSYRRYSAAVIDGKVDVSKYKLQCLGDGESAKRYNQDSGQMDLIVPCDIHICPDYQNKKCKRIAMIKFLLPLVKGIGFFQIDTTSWNSIVNLRSVLLLVQNASLDKSIAGKEFSLVVNIEKVKAADGKVYEQPIMKLLPKFTLADILKGESHTALPEPDVHSEGEIAPEELIPEVMNEEIIDAGEEQSVAIDSKIEIDPETGKPYKTSEQISDESFGESDASRAAEEKPDDTMDLVDEMLIAIRECKSQADIRLIPVKMLDIKPKVHQEAFRIITSAYNKKYNSLLIGKTPDKKK